MKINSLSKAVLTAMLVSGTLAVATPIHASSDTPSAVQTVKTQQTNDADVQAAVKQVAETLGSTGRILVRESSTEPVIRVMVEAETEEECEKYVDSVIDVIKEKGHCE